MKINVIVVDELKSDEDLQGMNVPNLGRLWGKFICS